MLSRKLYFDEIALGCDFHAALAADFPRRTDALLHTHDFPEAFYVLEGSGNHECNDHGETLRAGDLRWIRPQECHTFSVRPGQKMHFINIAFRQSVWEEFRRFAFGTSEETAWEAVPDPPAAHVPPVHRAACARLFGEMLHLFHTRPTRLALCRFWTEALPLLGVPLEEGAERASFAMSHELEGAFPIWLTQACLTMQSPAALKAGAPHFVALCGVSPAHLSRTFKAHTGQTPTEFVNTKRLEQAALLLATTTEEILSIADECGFENLSYFYRLFRHRYGLSPRRYRLAARQAVMP
jgi:hypothetical protein